MLVHFRPDTMSPRESLENLWSWEIIGHQNRELGKTGGSLSEGKGSEAGVGEPGPWATRLWSMAWLFILLGPQFSHL